MRISRGMILALLLVATVVTGALYGHRLTSPKPPASRWRAAMTELRAARGAARLIPAISLFRLSSNHAAEIENSVPGPALSADLGAIAGIVGTKGEDHQVRSALLQVFDAEGLGPLAQGVAAPLFRTLADESDEPYLRAGIASEIVGFASAERARAALIAAVRSRDPRVRVAALATIGQCRPDPEAFLALLNDAIEDPNRRVRDYAIVYASDLASKGSSDAVSLLLQASRKLQGQDHLDALNAIRSLGTRAMGILGELENDLRREADPARRVVLASTLAELTADRSRFTPIILDGLKAKDTSVVSMALDVLSSTSLGADRQERIKALEAMLRESDQRTQALAAIGLVQITGRIDDYRPYLERGSESEEPLIRSWCSVYTHLNRVGPSGAGIPRASGARIRQAAGSEWLWAVCVFGFLGMVMVMAYAYVDLKRRYGQPAAGNKRYYFFTHPRRIHLRPSESIAWSDPAVVADRLAALREMGFEPVGAFEVIESPAHRIWAMVKPDEHVAAIINDHDETGISLLLVTPYEDDSRFSVCNRKHTLIPPQRPGRQTVYVDFEDPAALFASLLAERPHRPMAPVSAEAFVAEYERAGSEYADWLASRGIMTADELRALNRSKGVELTEPEVEHLLSQLQQRALDDLDKSLRERFLDREVLPDASRAHLYPNLVVVHDRLHPGSLHERFLSVIDDEYHTNEMFEDDGIYFEPDEIGPAKMPDWEQLPPRLAFAALNARLAERERYLKVGELDWPLATDLYLAPS